MSTSTPSSTSHRARVWRFVVVGLLITGVLIAAVLHLPPVRARVLSLVTARLQQAGVELTAARLDYNLFALSVAIDEVTVAATGAAPFLSADAIRVNLPWTVLHSVGVEVVELDRPRLTLVRDSNGTLNLPAFAATPDGGGFNDPVLVRRLLARDLSVRYEDVAGDWRVEATGITLDMQRDGGRPLAGTFTMADPATLQVGDRGTTVTAAPAALTFDGRTVSIGGLRVDAAEGAARVNGTVDIVGVEPQVDLLYQAQVAVSAMSTWWRLDPAPTGTILLDGALHGARHAPMVTAAVTSNGLDWAGVGDVTVAADVTFAESVLTVDNGRSGLLGGEMSADGRIDFGAAGASRVNAAWQAIDLTRVAHLAGASPVTPAAISDGTFTATWTAGDLPGATGNLSSRLRATAAREGVLPVSGPVAVTFGSRQWTLTARPRLGTSLALDARSTGRLDEDMAATPVAGTLTLDASDLARAQDELAGAGLFDTFDDAGMVQGSASAALTLTGTAGAPRLRGSISSQDLRIGRAPPATLYADLDATMREVAVANLRVEADAGLVTGSTLIGLDANTIDGVVDAEWDDLSSVAAALPAAWRPAGAATLSATVSGALDDPTAIVHLSSQGLHIAGQTIDAIRSELSFRDGVLTVDTVEMAQGDGRLVGSGSYALDTRRYVADVTAESLTIRPPDQDRGSPLAGDDDGDVARLPLHASFDLQFNGEGSIDSPAGTGQVRFVFIDWNGYQLGPAVADLRLADGLAAVDVDLPSVAGTVDATLTVDTGHLTAAFTIAEAELAGLMRRTGPAALDPINGMENEAPAVVPMTGTLSLRATADGPLADPAALAVVVEADLADASVNGLPIRLDRTAIVRHGNGVLETDGIDLRLGAATLTGRGRLGAGAGPADEFALALVGTLPDLTPLFELVPGMAGVSTAGDVDLQVRASGRLDQPDLIGWITVVDGSFGTADLPAVEGVVLAASYSAGMLNVSTAMGRWQGAELFASGYAHAELIGDTLPAAFVDALPPALAPARFNVRLTGLSPDALAPFLDPESLDQISGRIDLAADVEATSLDLDTVTAEVRLDRAEVELARIPLSQSGPTLLRLADRRIDVVGWNWTGAGNFLTVSGHVSLDQPGAALDVGVTGSLDLRMIGAFAPAVAASGRATIDLTAHGPTSAPDIAGRVVLSGTDVILRDPRVAVTGLEGVAVLGAGRITLEGVTAEANGGRIAIIGDVDYTGTRITGGAIALSGRGLAVEAVEGLRTEVDTDLMLALAGDVPTLGGRITIVRGDYRQPIRLTEQLLATYETRFTAAGQPERGVLDELGLDLNIVSAQDLIVDNNYGRIEVGSNLRVTGTVGAPVVGGRLALREGGEIYLGGQSYTLQRGSVDFTSATRIEPTIDIALETRVRQYDITLELDGTPDRLEVTLRSPGLSQQDALSLLLTGQLADDTSIAYTDVARGQLLMLLSGELLSVAGRAVGLDSVHISRGLGGAASTFDLLATDSDPGARLTLAKNLSRDVELIYSQSLRDTGDITWIATYRPVRRVEFRAATDDNSDQTYEFRHELEFGGAPGAARARSDGGDVDPTISAIHFEGTPGFPSADLMGRMRQSAGERFDYFTWQQDRDRIAALYHDEGFYEATVSSRRRDETADTIALEYDIDRGPRTTILVRGYPLPSETVGAIATAWTQAVFDGFLVDDTAALVRRAMMRERHLQASVDVSMVAAADEADKTLLVAIDPGVRFVARRIEFQGNTRVASGTLRTVIETQGLDVSAWMEPASIASAIEAYYRSIGHLAADVTVAAPHFAGATATLPVVIDEGPEYRIGSIGVSGAAFRTPEVVRERSGLEAGSPYRPAAIEPARRAVELDYLEAGYNEVSVSALSGIDEAQALVDVVIAVAEGPQQVLREIDVVSSGVTSSRTIHRALDLRIDEPVNLSGLYEAQKRLYDTGVFRSVDITVEPVAGAGGTSSGRQPVEAVIVLDEFSRYRFRYGFRVTDLDGPAEGLRQIRPALVGDLLNRNVFGRAISAGVAAQVEADRRLARGVLSLPTVFGRPVVTNLFLTRSRQSIAPDAATPLTRDSLDITIEQRFRPARAMGVTYGYTYGRSRTFARNPDAEAMAPPADTHLNLGRITGTYAWDTRDDPSNATRGWFHSSGVELAPRRLGSEVSFVRYLAQQYFFRPVGTRTVLASALRLGVARGFDQAVPPGERFQAGGGSTVRGFPEQGLGGVDAAGAPIGGNSLLLFNQEVRFPVYRWFGGAAFVDLGNVFPSIRGLSLRDMQAGVGMGLRISSPFATLRIDYGVPMTDRDRRSGGRWYFAIGQTF